MQANAALSCLLKYAEHSCLQSLCPRLRSVESNYVWMETAWLIIPETEEN